MVSPLEVERLVRKMLLALITAMIPVTVSPAPRPQTAQRLNQSEDPKLSGEGRRFAVSDSLRGPEELEEFKALGGSSRAAKSFRQSLQSKPRTLLQSWTTCVFSIAAVPVPYCLYCIQAGPHADNFSVAEASLTYCELGLQGW